MKTTVFMLALAIMALLFVPVPFWLVLRSQKERKHAEQQGAASGCGGSAQTPCATPGTLKYIVANNPGGDYQFQVAAGGNVAVIDNRATEEGSGFYPPEKFAPPDFLASISTTSTMPNS